MISLAISAFLAFVCNGEPYFIYVYPRNALHQTKLLPNELLPFSVLSKFYGYLTTPAYIDAVAVPTSYPHVMVTMSLAVIYVYIIYKASSHYDSARGIFLIFCFYKLLFSYINKTNLLIMLLILKKINISW